MWDTGTYETEKWSDREVMVVFHGERVAGKYVLFQTRGNQWMIHRMDPPADPDAPAAPDDLRPMTATLAKATTARRQLGVRTEVGRHPRARLRRRRAHPARTSRNGNEITHRYPELRKLGETLGAREVILDGEIAAFDDAGRPSFEKSAAAHARRRRRRRSGGS